jgi:hypothetical protein
MQPLAVGAHGVLIWGHLDSVGSPQSPNSVTSYNRYTGQVLGGIIRSICSQYMCCTNVSNCFKDT